MLAKRLFQKAIGHHHHHSQVRIRLSLSNSAYFVLIHSFIRYNSSAYSVSDYVYDSDMEIFRLFVYFFIFDSM